MTGAGTRSQELAALQQQLASAGYIAEPQLAAALLLMQDLGRPLLLEGDAGVGKTEVAKVLAEIRATRLIRLQCYEGLDAHAAMYEWNYQRQLLAIKAREGSGASAGDQLTAGFDDVQSRAFVLVMNGKNDEAQNTIETALKLEKDTAKHKELTYLLAAI